MQSATLERVGCLMMRIAAATIKCIKNPIFHNEMIDYLRI